MQCTTYLLVTTYGYFHSLLLTATYYIRIYLSQPIVNCNVLRIYLTQPIVNCNVLRIYLFQPIVKCHVLRVYL